MNNMYLNKLVSNIFQEENLGKTIYETFQGQETNPETIDQMIQSIHKQILLAEENTIKLQPESQPDVEDLEKEWKEINITAERNITSDFQKKLTMFVQKAQKILNIQDNVEQNVENKPSKEEISDTPEIDDLPSFITCRAAMFGERLESMDPCKLWKWATYIKSHPSSFFPEEPLKRMQDAAQRLLWIQQCFPEMTKTDRFQEALKGLTNEGVILKHFAEGCTSQCKVNVPLTLKHTHLCIGTGTTSENTRKHDLETSYTINLNDSGEPHVSDDIQMLTSRKYLNDENGKPHQFEEIFVEVSCNELLFLYPEFMQFMNSHLKPGGKLFLELGYALLNDSIKEAEKFSHSGNWALSIPMAKEWPWPNENIKVIPSEIETTTYKYDSEFNEAQIIVKFNGDWKGFFSRFGFTDAHISQIDGVQLGSLPIEMTKKA